MPFLQKAKQVEIIIIGGKPPKSGEVSGADLGQHLARHGLKVDVKRITSPDIDVASTILSYAADSSADMLVMGGYGHSRLREFVLGGVTRGILESMTVPTLMSHFSGRSSRNADDAGETGITLKARYRRNAGAAAAAARRRRRALSGFSP